MISETEGLWRIRQCCDAYDDPATSDEWVPIWEIRAILQEVEP